MIFETERALQQKLAKLDFELIESHPVSFTRREVRVGGCIPDLVSVHFIKDPNSHTWPKKWSYRHSYVIWLLRNKNQNLENLASLFFEPTRRIAPIVDDLISNGIIVKTRSGQLSLAKHVQNDLKANVIAVEAKLKDWRQALYQAVRYKEFANIVFVALDASTIPDSEKSLDLFRDQQIGLCGISLHSLDWVVQPIMREHGVGHAKEYLVMSATIPTTQRLWSRRNNLNASSHA